MKPSSDELGPLYPIFLKLRGRRVLLVGGGEVGRAKGQSLVDAGARLAVVAPEIHPELAAMASEVHRRPFAPEDLAGAWLVVAAAPREVNRAVEVAAEPRCLFVNAVDDPRAASAYAAATLRRGPVTLAVSTGGAAPALAGLVREALEALLPEDLPRWGDVAAEARRRWKAEGRPMAERRPLLLEALSALYQDRAAANIADVATVGGLASGAQASLPPGTGRVTLMGSGPGDPDLLTVRAHRRLAEADLVLFDALAAQDLRPLCPEARWFYVGKRAGRESMRQDVINRLMIREARRGHEVVRLKGGDPFVLGRGGEEALALAEAGVPFEVIPGVTSAVAAPALAGIPVTHRGLSSGFVVLSGHSQSAYGPAIDGLGPDSALTVVILMGYASRADIAARLLARGFAEDTPAALVVGAATAGAWRWLGRLGDLPRSAIPDDRLAAGAPVLMVVGAVVALAETLSPTTTASSSSSGAGPLRGRDAG